MNVMGITRQLLRLRGRRRRLSGLLVLFLLAAVMYYALAGWSEVSQPAASPTGADCVPPGTPQAAVVARVVDGDTLRVQIDGQEYAVRYIGVNAPEDTTKHEPYGPEATQYNALLTQGQSVWLYRDVSEVDRYGRLLRYVTRTDGLFINLELVRAGYAQASTYPPDVACAEAFRWAEQEARVNGLGLWGGRR